MSVDAEGRQHPYTTLDYQSEPVEVDVEIAPLIELVAQSH